MLKKISLLVLLSMVVLPALSEARFGGGSSFGSRGSRGVSPRSSGGFGSGSSRFGSNVAPSRPMTPPAAAPFQSSGLGGGGFFRGMAGGLAGGFLGSMLFRSMGYGAGMGGMGGGGGFGLLEMLLIGGLLFFGIRWVMARAATAGGPSAQGSIFQGLGAQRQQPELRIVNSEATSVSGAAPANEDSVIDTIRRYDGAFDVARFKDSRVDDFFKIQAAWGGRDLAPIRPLVAGDIAKSLESEVLGLKANGRINRIENIAVRETQLTEAWQEFGKEFVTLRFYANLLDYTVDEKTGSVVEGSKNEPVKFEEYWTYAREVGRPTSPWLLTAIEQQS